MLLEIKGFLSLKNFLSCFFDGSEGILLEKMSRDACVPNRYSNSEKHCTLANISNAGVSGVFF